MHKSDSQSVMTSNIKKNLISSSNDARNIEHGQIVKQKFPLLSPRKQTLPISSTVDNIAKGADDVRKL